MRPDLSPVSGFWVTNRHLSPTFALSELSNCLFLQKSPCLHDPSRGGSHAALLSTLTNLGHSVTAVKRRLWANTHFPAGTFRIKCSLHVAIFAWNILMSVFRHRGSHEATHASKVYVHQCFWHHSNVQVLQLWARKLDIGTDWSDEHLLKAGLNVGLNEWRYMKWNKPKR